MRCAIGDREKKNERPSIQARRMWSGALQSGPADSDAKRAHRMDGSTLMGTCNLTAAPISEKPSFESFRKAFAAHDAEAFAALRHDELLSAWQDIPSPFYRRAFLLEAFGSLSDRASVRDAVLSHAPPILERAKSDLEPVPEDEVDTRLGRLAQ